MDVVVVSEASERPGEMIRSVRPLNVMTVGAGVVGHATGAALSQHGHRVRFCDIDEHLLARRRAEGFVTAPLSELDLTDIDVVLISVVTPTKDGTSDLRQLELAVETIGRAMGASAEPSYRVVIVRSTVPPGTTEAAVLPALEAASGLRAGPDFGVCMSPEYLRERWATSDASTPRLVVIGELDRRSGDVAEQIFSSFACPRYRVPIREAEFHKYAHNLYNAAKISFFNELRRAASAIDVDSERVFSLVTQSAEAMWNPSYGTFDLGPYGGACLPKDVEAFLSWACDEGLFLPMLAAMHETNRIEGTR